MTKLRKGFGSAATVALLTGISTAAYAQSAAAPAQDAAVAPLEDQSNIVVTGSRIVRNGYDYPTPTVVTTAQDLQATSPQNLTEGLNKLPAFAGSQTQAGSGSGSLGSGGVNNIGSFLNLRNFGTIRTLILLDGRRVPATNFDGNVDVDTLPQALIQRVDVVTGGASAVYGSDAVTGVVNYVLDRKFTGFRGTVQSGISGYGDDGQQRVNLGFGTKLFGGRGHLLLSAEYNNSKGVPTKESRPWFKDQLLTGSGTAAAPYATVDYGRQNTSSFGGLIRKTSTINANLPTSLANMTFNPDGTLRPFDSGTRTNTSTFSSGGDGTYHPFTSMIASLKTKQGFGRFEYELFDNVTAFVQGTYSDSRSIHTQATPNRSDTATNAIVIYSGNAYLRPEIQQILTANNIPSFTLSEYTIDAGRPTFDIRTRSLTGTAGLEGKIGNFHWDLSYIHGEGRTHQIQHQNSNNAHFYAAVDAVRDPATGNIVCRVTLTNPGLYPGCVPINVLGRGNAMPEAIAYVTNDTGWTALNKTDDIVANFGGDLFRTWAGPVSISVGGEYRHQSLLQTTTDSPLSTPDFTGLRGGFTSSTISYVGVLVAGAQGSEHVAEGNVELLVPLLRDSILGRSLDLNGAFRYTDYSTSGAVKTWKAGLDYQITDDVRLRGVISRDIRAPTLYDLFAAVQVRNQILTDPLTGIAATTQSMTGGNPNLKPEVSRTYTAGVVLTPHFLPGFKASVDYYYIRIENAIGTVPIDVQIRECTASGGTSPFCANINRPLGLTNTGAANFPTSYFNGTINAALNETSGLDMEVDYVKPLPMANGSISIRMLADYQPHYKIRSYAGAQTLDYAGVGANFSKWRWTTQVNLALDKINATVLNRWYSGVKWDADPTLVYADPAPGAYDVVDLTLSTEIKAWGGNLQPFLSINNLLNRYPRIFANSSPGQVTPVVAGDDVIGRYFTMGVRFRF